MLVTEDLRPSTEFVTKRKAAQHERSSCGAPANDSSGEFQTRHIGPNPSEAKQMLELLGFSTLDELIDAAVPRSIRLSRALQIPAGRGESEVLSALKEIASQNQVFRSYIGMGYSDCITPAVIQRALFENPGLY